MSKDRLDNYISKLQQMIRIETVSDPDCGSPPENFDRFCALIRELFPNIFTKCEVMEFDRSFLIRWPGRDGSRKPVLFMNHYDVVPAKPEGWKYPPFSGYYTEGKVWGRGALDDKGGLWSMLEAGEQLIEEGFVPSRDIYFEMDCKEETTGHGAEMAANWFRDNGIRLDMSFDEGGEIVYEPIRSVDGTFAMIGVAEKSVVNMKFTARSKGGHASTPGKNTPLVRLGKFMAYIDKHNVFDVELSPTIAEMLTRFLPYMGGTGRMISDARRLKRPIESILPRLGPTANSLLTTTIAFSLAGGGEAVNTIPREAWVIGDMRCSPHQGQQSSIDAITKAAAKFGLEAEPIDICVGSGITDYHGTAFRLVEKAVAATVPGVDACAPYIMTGASDSRFIDKVCDQCIRFRPFRITPEQLESIHGVNESVDIAALQPAVDYYRYMMQHI